LAGDFRAADGCNRLGVFLASREFDTEVRSACERALAGQPPTSQRKSGRPVWLMRST